MKITSSKKLFYYLKENIGISYLCIFCKKKVNLGNYD